MILRARSILSIFFILMSILPNSPIYTQDSSDNIAVFWSQALTFMQYTYDEYTSLDTISNRLERLHHVKTPDGMKSWYNKIQCYVTRSLWQHIQQKRIEQNMIDLEIGMLGERAVSLGPDHRKIDRTELEKDFYHLVYNWCQKNDIKLKLVENVTTAEYQHQTDLLLTKIKERAEHGVIPQSFFEKASEQLLSSSLLTNILPSVLPIVIRIVVFYLLWGHFDQCVSFIEQIALSSSDLVAANYGTLLKKTVHTAQSLLFAETITCGACSIWQAIAKPMYERKVSLKTAQNKIRENIANKVYVPKCSFEDIIGYEAIKKECGSIIQLLKNPLLASIYQVVTPKGLLVSGPKGVGKKNFAQAIAHEAKLSIITIKTSDFLIKNGGERISALFNEARCIAPCMIFIEDLTELFSEILLDERNNGQNTLGVLLNEIETLQYQQIYRPIILATTTSNIKNLNPLLKKCFDRIIDVPLPDETTRSKLFMHYLRNDSNFRSFDYAQLALLSGSMTGKTIKEILQRAHESVLEDHTASLTMEKLTDHLSTYSPN